MLGKIVKHELLLLRKDKIVLLFTVGFAVVIGYAIVNRSAEIEKFKPTVKEWAAIQERNTQKRKDVVIDIERKIAAGEYRDEVPLVYNMRDPRDAATNLRPTIPLPPAPLGALAVGRTDLDTFAYRFTIDEPPSPGREQTDYPLRLLVGRVDPAFVMLYLYPLFILALSFNMIAGERENGTLALLLSQPLSMRSLALGKTLARAAVIFGATLLFSVIALLLSDVNFNDSGVNAGLVLWFAAILIYGVFWFGLALVANALARTSAACALMLVVGWFALTILIPASINLAATLIYPVPSRAEFINARRAETSEISLEKENRGERIKQFLADHPEFPADYQYTETALNWMDNAQRIVEREKRMQPINERFDGQIKRQRRFVKFAGIASPLTVMQNLLPEIAGSGHLRHASFLAQIYDFQRSWRDLFWTKVFFQKPMASNDFDLIPRFRITEIPAAVLIKESLAPLLLLTAQMLLVVYFGLRFYRKPAFGS